MSLHSSPIDKRFLFFLLILFVQFIFPLRIIFAQEQERPYPARITAVHSSENENGYYQRLIVTFESGPEIGKTTEIDTSELPIAKEQSYSVGDKVFVQHVSGVNGTDVYYITDFVRKVPLFFLAALFVLVSILVARKKSIAAFVGMGVSFVVIRYILLPLILAHTHPILVSFIGGASIIPVTFYISHGFTKKTTVAIIGTIISLTVAATLAQLFIISTKLTGYTTDEASFLHLTSEGTISMTGLLLVGMVIGLLGILDDITIAQSSIVSELAKADKKLSIIELYTRSMNVGKDHIASLINTLFLVYAGASLPLLLLFVGASQPLDILIQQEVIAEEIVRTLIGSIGIVMAVPITTAIAAVAVKRYKM